MVLPCYLEVICLVPSFRIYIENDQASRCRTITLHHFTLDCKRGLVNLTATDEDSLVVKLRYGEVHAAVLG